MTSDGFCADSIGQLLSTEWLGKGKRLLFYDETDSTNEEVKRLADRGAEEGIMVVADNQVRGKGRKGRSWEAPSGTNIAMSYLLRPHIIPDKAPMMTLLMALACVKALKNVADIDISIKWPNDIVCGGRKLAGILTEMVLDNGEISYVVIGTGINVNLEEIPDHLHDTATSLKLETGRRFSRSGITAECAAAFEDYYDIFTKDNDLSGLKDEYNSVCVNTGRRVRVQDPTGEYEGTAEGINNAGDLIVIRDDGSITKVYAGEVSVRGIYGYT